MRIDVVTLFPEIIRAYVDVGIVGRAVKRGLVQLGTWNPRDYTSDVHRTVDDRPYGGGPGMVMKVEPLHEALQDARKQHDERPSVIYLSPQGRRLDQAMVAELAQQPWLILVAGRYEGIDERFIEQEIDEEVSIGDYVLSGGELAALTMIDAVTRLQPEALGDADSAEQDSFSDGLLDCPHYTRPEKLQGEAVPEVLLSGNHKLIARWRRKQALGRTWSRRPDMLQDRVLNDEDQRLLEEYILENKTD